MRALFLIICALLYLLPTLDGVAQLREVPPLTGLVVDQVGVLGGTKGELEVQLRKLKEEKGSEVAVLIVGSTAPEAIEQFGIRVVDQWKIGRKGIDDGVLILVALEDRAVRIEVGRGLEGDLPDVTVFRIIQEQILPRFRQGDIPGGISGGVQSVVNRINGLDLPPPVVEDHGQGAGALVVILLFFLIGSVLAAAFGNGLGATSSAALGMLSALLFSSFVGSLAIGGGIWLLVFFREVVFEALAAGSRGGYSSGRGGYSGTFGGGSFGSGGSFSGGGASGRW
jgi:uncharacterized protein